MIVVVVMFLSYSINLLCGAQNAWLCNLKVKPHSSLSSSIESRPRFGIAKENDVKPTTTRENQFLPTQRSFRPPFLINEAMTLRQSDVFKAQGRLK
jgi:hypothetical protein